MLMEQDFKLCHFGNFMNLQMEISNFVTVVIWWPESTYKAKVLALNSAVLCSILYEYEMTTVYSDGRPNVLLLI